MKKYLRELIIFLLQILVLYICPLFAGPTDAMGMVLLMLIITFILSITISLFDNKIKYFYPVIISLIFIPTVYIYYNDSALIHSVWYLIDSLLGVFIGFIINKIRR